MEDQDSPYELVIMNKYRWWKLSQPKPPLIYQRDRLKIVPDEPEEESQDNNAE